MQRADIFSRTASRKAMNCARCGVEISPRRSGSPFCCAGCALLGRVPLDAEGNFPVNRWLIIGLAVLFLYFNQLLLWSAIVWNVHHGKLHLAERLTLAELGVALLVWLSQCAAIIMTRVYGAKEFLFATIVIGLLVFSVRTVPPSSAILAAGNFVFLLWNVRGLFRRRVV